MVLIIDPRAVSRPDPTGAEGRNCGKPQYAGGTTPYSGDPPASNVLGMSSHINEESPPLRRSALPAREIVLFVLLAFGLAWLVHVPALVTGATPEDPIYGLSATLYMFTPAIAALVIAYFVWRPRSVLRATGLTPLRPVRRVGGYSLDALLILPVAGAVAPLLAAAFGIIRLDLTGFSGYREALVELAPPVVGHLPESGFPLSALLMGIGFAVVTIFPFALLICFGEELGWRGYLLPRLLPLGVWPALLVSGIIHGLWHAPQLFIQFTSGFFSLAQILVFLAFCLVIGVLLGWLRLASGSVWPAVLAHAANNTFGIMGFLFLAHADSPTDPVLYAGGTGGVIGMAVTIVFLLPVVLTGRIRVRSFEPSLEEGRARPTR